MKRSLTILSLILIIGAFYLNACNKAGNWLVKKDLPFHSDAMVILMGSIPDRVLQCADLYHQGMAGRVMLVNEYSEGMADLRKRGVYLPDETEEALKALIMLGIPSDSISVLPGNARSTVDEAMVIRKYLKNNSEIRSLILVSSSAHTRRASIIFKSAFRKAGEKINVSCSPSTYSSFDSSHWWKNKNGIQTVLLEYLKLADFLLLDNYRLNTIEE